MLSPLWFVIPVATLAAPDSAAIDFATQVRPLFQEHCVSCHGPDDSNGGLRLDHARGAFVEGDSGEQAIVAGDVSASEVLNRITSQDEDQRMPPEGPPLSKSEIDLLRRWIQAGAKWPVEGEQVEEQDASAGHWSFQPIASPSVPDADDWSDHPIDRFLQEGRKAAGLHVTHDATPQVMLRRLTYGLLGLPPNSDEIRAFAQNWEQQGPETAVAEAIDGLLARREYGERWGRHWMDWVRYADTAGDNSDYPIPQAYLYRNYIIDSFNDDVPYDRFLTEQLAGDLLPAEDQQQRNRQVVATGYLAMARRFGSLVETYPWHLTIEDTIDNVGKTMLGMTLACARCHDHKFDPVTTREYYGLYGFFASTQYPFPGIELFKAQHHFVSLLPEQETDAHLDEFSQETERLQKTLDELLEECRLKSEENAQRHAAASVEEQRRMHDELEKMLLKARKAGGNLEKHLRTIPEFPTAYAVRDTTPVDASIQVKGEPARPGATVPRQFPRVLGGQVLPQAVAESGSGRLQLANWIASPDNPMTARVIVNRVWQRHFGRGIVPSTTDFGLRGQTPDHPELLDWLAQDFIAHGWSIKQLHRRILTSRTYRLSSDGVAGQKGQDPENVHLSHQRRQRLDAESIRDTILLLSGELDPEPMTEPHPFPARDKWTFTQHHPFKDSYESRKRSVYLMTKRLTADRYFQTFDGPDRNVCTQSRDQSITALQALYFVNNDFLHKQAHSLAERMPTNIKDDGQKLDHLVNHILQRSPGPEERGWLLEHLHGARQQAENENEAWASLARSLFRLNEFIYVD